MVLQKIIFPKNNTSTELYYRKNNDILSFDTYFNSFSIEKWKKYTNLKKLYLEIYSKDKINIKFLNKKIIKNKVETRILNSISVDNNKYEFNLEEISEGIISFEINQSDLKNIERIEYKTHLCVENEVKLGVVVCTYNRKIYVENLIKIFNNILLDKDNEYEISFYIIDNAQNLEIISKNDKIKIIKNKNYGGAGGFTRGIIESMNCGDTNILLMDDDVEIEEEAIKRLYSFLKILKGKYDDYFISGGMFLKGRENIQHELTGVWEIYKNKSLRGNKNLINIKEVLLNEKEYSEKLRYGAWWFCSFSRKNISENGLPFPFFIKGDDIEFSLRNGSKLITLNGLSVWHEDFKKKYSSFLYYYTVRNNILINILTEKINYNRMNFFFNIFLRYIYNILRTRIKELRLTRKALEDVNSGSNFFKTMKPDIYHQEIIKFNNEKIYFFYEFYKSIQIVFKILISFDKMMQDYKIRRYEFFSKNFWENYLEMRGENDRDTEI